MHLVFSTKDRRPFLGDLRLRDEAHRYLGGVSRTLGCPTIVVGGVEDHVHILTTLGKTVSQSEWVKELKRVSSGWIKEKGVADFAWQGGYGAFSVDGTRLDRIRRYIQNQPDHHRAFSFQDEFRQPLVEHGIAFDERYLWE